MKDCKECFAVNIMEHPYTEQVIFECGIAEKGVGDLYTIPDWCPLRKEEQNESDMEQA